MYRINTALSTELNFGSGRKVDVLYDQTLSKLNVYQTNESNKPENK